MRRILLFGNPNVGKSTIFLRLTGIDVITSNYPGTTVEFTKGYLKIGNKSYEVIDVPGTYTLKPTTNAEEVALEFIKKRRRDDIIVNILDSTNLERQLNLTFQLLKKRVPMIIVLNFWDETKHCGISIDFKKLEKILNVPVIPVCGRTGYGIKEFIDRIEEAKVSNFKYLNEKEKWQNIGKVVSLVQKIRHKHHTFLNTLEEISINPLTGIPLALIILFLSFVVIRFIGESLISILDPLYNQYYVPFVTGFVKRYIKLKFLEVLLLGSKPQPLESFGILITGLYIPLVVVLPYIISFYFVLGILEDIGYLPRLAVILDVFLHKIGVHGSAAIPILLGLGCKVPAIFSTRILETQREKIIATSLILMMAPCMPQTAMIISLISPYGFKWTAIVFLILFLNSVFISFLLNKILKGETPELFTELPPYRVPYIPTLLRKIWIRLKSFLIEAVPMIILGIAFVGILDVLNVFDFFKKILGKPVKYILGLPEETVSVIIFGFLRKDVSISLLAPFKLTAKQLVIGSVFLTLYLPCLATILTMLNELKLKNSLKIIFIMFTSGFLIGMILNLIL